MKSKLDIHKLPSDARYVTKHHFNDIVTYLITTIFRSSVSPEEFEKHASGLNNNGPGVLFDYIKQNRETFGKIDKVVDLLALLDVIKKYSESHRRSFDYGNSKIKHDIAFWNLSSSNLRTPSTDYPIPSPQKEGDRVSSKGALRRKKYEHISGAGKLD